MRIQLCSNQDPGVINGAKPRGHRLMYAYMNILLLNIYVNYKCKSFNILCVASLGHANSSLFKS